MAAFLARSVLLPLAVIAAGLAFAAYLGGYVERVRPQLPAEYEDSDLSLNGSYLKGYALGCEGLIADWYWMRSLQYIGNKIDRADDDTLNIDDLRNLNPRLLYPMLDNATDLDPHFIAVYNYGAVVMPAIDPEKAIRITQKGIANNPNEWRLYQYLGYIYWKLTLYDQAAETYQRGSEIPGAAPFMRLMAASMKNQGGSRETARVIYADMLSSDDPQIRSTAEKRIAELNSFDEQEAIDKALADHRERSGRCAASLTEIVPALTHVKLPGGNDFRVDAAGRLLDPTGAPYLLDKEDCRSKVDFEHSALPLR
jgi:tetratricopeptide (TPR) repeat protein